jgi:hypothetical protein
MRDLANAPAETGHYTFAEAAMHQRAIERQTWADIRDGMTTFEQSKPGAWWVSVGRHPELGCITVIEDFEPMVMLLSEYPLVGLHNSGGFKVTAEGNAN